MNLSSIKIPIVLSCDNNYAIPLFVTLTSLFENASQKDCFEIFILDGGIAASFQEKISAMVNGNGSSLQFIQINPEDVKDFFVDKHVTVSTYYRILIAKLLPESYQRVLYLDVDIIINDNILELWKEGTTNFVLAAVRDVNSQRFSELGMDESLPYFNAGVLLINLAEWRKGNWTEKLIKFIHENPSKLKFWDQDALNINLIGKWRALDPKWNYLEDRYFHVARKPPSIIHYVASFKPWHYRSRHPYKYLYYKYLGKTPLEKGKQADYSHMNFLKKQVSYLLIYLGLKEK